MPLICTSCKRNDAIYVRPYSGEKLCNRCFIRSIENKVRRTIAKYNMLHFNDKIAVGVSGGKDSMALLHILAKMEKPFPKAELVAITVDEGIPGYRDEALEIAKKGCLKLGVEHVIVSFQEFFNFNLDELAKKLVEDKATNRGLTFCAYCGVLRRRALNSTAKRCKATRLATAHNLDDEAQTIFLNILHGDPLRITRAKPVSPFTHTGFVPRIKPFCEILEKETTLYAYLQKIKFQNIPCPYAGAALRNDIRSMLNKLEAKHPGTKYAVYRSAEKLWSSAELSKKIERLRICGICGEPTVNEVCQPCKMLQEFDI